MLQKQGNLDSKAMQYQQITVKKKSIWREHNELNVCMFACVFGETVRQSKRVGKVCNICWIKISVGFQC